MPKSRIRKKKRAAGRRRPAEAGRPPRREKALPPLDSLIRPVLRGGGELLELQDPLDAERWASQVLGVWFKMALPPPARMEFEPRIRREIVDAAERAGTPETLAVLRAFAAMEPDPIAVPAREAAERLAAGGVPDQSWVRELGSAECIDAWTLTDPYGDQDGYYLSFRYPDRPPHMLMALVDRNLGGIVKDAFCRTPIADVRAKAATYPDAVVTDVEPGEAAATILRAIEIGDEYLDNDWTRDFKDTRALLLARMSRLPHAPLPEPAEALEASKREAIVKEFLALSNLPDHDAAESIAWLCLDYACDYTPDGDPFRWSPIVVECFLLGWLPRKAMLDAGEIRAMPEILKAWVGFALGRRGLPSRLIEETKSAVEEFMPAFRRAATDHASFGPAKAITSAMMAAGIDLRDKAAVDAWIEDFNRRPHHERDELLGPSPFDLD